MKVLLAVLLAVVLNWQCDNYILQIFFRVTGGGPLFARLTFGSIGLRRCHHKFYSSHEDDSSEYLAHTQQLDNSPSELAASAISLDTARLMSFVRYSHEDSQTLAQSEKTDNANLSSSLRHSYGQIFIPVTVKRFSPVLPMVWGEDDKAYLVMRAPEQ